MCHLIVENEYIFSIQAKDKCKWFKKGGDMPDRGSVNSNLDALRNYLHFQRLVSENEYFLKGSVKILNL